MKYFKLYNILHYITSSSVQPDQNIHEKDMVEDFDIRISFDLLAQADVFASFYFSEPLRVYQAVFFK